MRAMSVRAGIHVELSIVTNISTNHSYSLPRSPVTVADLSAQVRSLYVHSNSRSLSVQAIINMELSEAFTYPIVGEEVCCHYQTIYI